MAETQVHDPDAVAMRAFRRTADLQAGGGRLYADGTLSDCHIKGLQPIDSELRAFEFCDEGQAKERLRPYVWRRASAALEALGTGRGYLQDGYA